MRLRKSFDLVTSLAIITNRITINYKTWTKINWNWRNNWKLKGIFFPWYNFDSHLLFDSFWVRVQVLIWWALITKKNLWTVSKIVWKVNEEKRSNYKSELSNQIVRVRHFFAKRIILVATLKKSITYWNLVVKTVF